MLFTLVSTYLSTKEVDKRQEDERGKACIDQSPHKVPPLPPCNQLISVEKTVPVVEGQLKGRRERKQRLIGVLDKGVDQVIRFALWVEVAVQADEFSVGRETIYKNKVMVLR